MQVLLRRSLSVSRCMIPQVGPPSPPACISNSRLSPVSAGASVATGSGGGSVPGGNGVTIWNYTTPIALPGATLWHLVAPPAMPALYRLQTTLSIGGVVVDAENVTFGIRQTAWDGATGFWLNGINTKILGTANHQVWCR